MLSVPDTFVSPQNELPAMLESITIVSVLIGLVLLGAVGALRAIVRGSVSTSGQTVTPSSYDFWIYLIGDCFAFAFGIYGLVRYLFFS